MRKSTLRSFQFILSFGIALGLAPLCHANCDHALASFNLDLEPVFTGVGIQVFQESDFISKANVKAMLEDYPFLPGHKIVFDSGTEYQKMIDENSRVLFEKFVKKHKKLGLLIEAMRIANIRKTLQKLGETSEISSESFYNFLNESPYQVAFRRFKGDQSDAETSVFHIHRNHLVATFELLGPGTRTMNPSIKIASMNEHEVYQLAKANKIPGEVHESSTFQLNLVDGVYHPNGGLHSSPTQDRNGLSKARFAIIVIIYAPQSQ